MSGASDVTRCPKCGGEMHTYVDWKPHDFVDGECLDCGFCFTTVDGQLTLEQVNERRAEYEMELLAELRKQVQQDDHARER